MSEEPKSITFKYSLEFEEVPHNADTVQWALGSDYYNPDFGEDVHARQILADLFRDATLHRLKMSMNFAGKDGFEEICELNDKKIEIYRKIEKSLKLINKTD